MKQQNQATASQGSSSDQINPVQVAAAPCPQAETANANTVPTVAAPQPTNNASATGAKNPLTFATSERQPGHCKQCGAKLTIKRPRNFKPKRFCNSQCKRRHFYQTHGK